MSMTEEEATKRWCPFARVRAYEHASNGTNGPPINRQYGPSDFPPGACCIGSRCMAWRESGEVRSTNPAGDVVPLGYCGLAKKS